VAVRTLVVECSDWPIVASGRPPSESTAVVLANRVVACSQGARSQGVVVGMRRRQAQGRSPTLVVLERDVAAEARAFESVVIALDQITPRVELSLPGNCAFPTVGPSRYFGGDKRLAAKVSTLVAEVLEGRGVQHVGIADGPFAAGLAARAASPAESLVVPPGESRAFLGPLPAAVLERPDLVDVLARLGIHTLGELARLPAADVVGRFGREGSQAHNLARGLDERPLAVSDPPSDLEVSAELEPPVERVDQAAFVAKSLADELCSELTRLGTTCFRVLITAETEHGEELSRLWRGEEAMYAGTIADRVRWQLDGWLNASPGSRPSGGLVRLALRPDQIGPAVGRQLGFWGGQTASAERAARAVARVQGLLGAGSVVVPEVRGGRNPSEHVVAVAAEAVDLVEREAATSDSPPAEAPWPGSLPPPAPARVPVQPIQVEVLDANGRRLGVSGRGLPTGDPRWLEVGGQRRDIEAWAGPWPVDERWWDPQRRSRRARFQIVTEGGNAHVVTLESGVWSIEATYD
jgi:protein ImuB